MNDAPKNEIQPAEAGHGVKPPRCDRTQLPDDFLTSSRFVNWRLEEHEGRQNCKIPYDPKNPKRRGDSTDPSTQGTLDQALAADPEHVGLVIGPPFATVDLDKCIDDAGVVAPWALELIASLPPTYTEYSPSKHGFHLWFKAKAPKDMPEGVRAPDLEVYRSKRYFTLTTDRVKGTPREIATLSDDQLRYLLSVVESRKKKKKADPTTPRTKPQSEKLKLLMEGRFEDAGFGDVSAAVQSLLTLLAIEHLLDRSKVEEEFKKSGLYRDFRPLGRASNWIEKWERLRTEELDKAIAQAREVIAKQRTKYQEKFDDGDRSLVIINAEDRQRVHVTFIWDPYLPDSVLVHFAGNSGEGKSPVTVDLAARITAGQDWPDGKTNTLGPRTVLMLNNEDDFDSVILPRFVLAGGRPDKLRYLKATAVKKGDLVSEVGVALDRDMERIKEYARATPDLLCIFIDPVTNHLGSKKMNQEEEVRTVLMPLATLAGELGITIITVGHFNRREKGTEVLQRMMGAAAFVGVSRAAYSFSKDPDSDGQHDHVMTCVRGALGEGEGLKYRTEKVEQEWDGRTSGVIRVVWGEKTATTAQEAADGPSSLEKGQEADVAETLAEFLKDGKERSATDCQKHVGEQHRDLDLRKANWSRIRRRANVKHERGKGRNLHLWKLNLAQSTIEEIL